VSETSKGRELLGVLGRDGFSPGLDALAGTVRYRRIEDGRWGELNRLYRELVGLRGKLLAAQRPESGEPLQCMKLSHINDGLPCPRMFSNRSDWCAFCQSATPEPSDADTGHSLTPVSTWQAKCEQCGRVGPDQSGWWAQFECATPEPEPPESGEPFTETEWEDDDVLLTTFTATVLREDAEAVRGALVRVLGLEEMLGPESVEPGGERLEALKALDKLYSLADGGAEEGRASVEAYQTVLAAFSERRICDGCGSEITFPAWCAGCSEDIWTRSKMLAAQEQAEKWINLTEYMSTKCPEAHLMVGRNAGDAAIAVIEHQRREIALLRRQVEGSLQPTGDSE